MSAPSSNNTTPLAAAKTFLAGIKSRDKDSMRAVSHPDATACLIRNGKPIHTTVEYVLERIGSEAVEMEEVSYDEVEHVDGLFASVWTPYRSFEDGKACLPYNDGSVNSRTNACQIHHAGSNNFTLWKSPEKGWIITSVQDIAREAEGVTNLSIVGGHDRDV